MPSPGDLPDPGIKPGSPALQADSLPSEGLLFKHAWEILLFLEIHSETIQCPTVRVQQSEIPLTLSESHS